jgi:DNA-binding CsgD family transcriptional regulator
MQAEPETFPLLTGPEEAALYHHAGDRGFFTLLWADPEQAARAARVAAQRRQIKLELVAQLATPLTLFDPPALKIDELRARLEALPRLSSKIQRAYRLSDLPTVIEALDQERDTWISQAEFIKPNRRVVYLLRLNLCFVDLDTYKTPWNGNPPEWLSHRVWGYCLDEGIPAPSLILYSGRGLQVKWLLERPLPRAALPRWNAVQKQLVANLAPFGADPGARDASRLLRLVDTVNTRSGERVRVLWVNERDGEVQHYNFEFLAETILPLARETIRDDRKAKAERCARLTVLPGGKTGNLRAFSGRQLAWDRLEDLRTLAKLRGWMESGVPHGYRSKYLHWCLNFLLLSGAVHSSQLFQEAQALVREVCPDFSKEVRSILSTLYRKAQAYEAGEKIEFGGRMYPPLYTPKNSTLQELFEIQDAETPYLKTIITAVEAAERHRERNRKAVDRATYLETAEQRRVEARLRRAKGESLQQIADALGVSLDTVKSYLYRSM